MENVQVVRWTFTLNNYDADKDYIAYFKTPSFKIKRCVFGFEIGKNHVPHIQGYLELLRSLRFSHVKKILPEAHWEKASKTPYINYRYCTKQGQFLTIGDFSNEERERSRLGSKPQSMSVKCVIRKLMDPKTEWEVKLRPEYAQRHSYFDKMVYSLKSMKEMHDLYLQWREKKLRLWQFSCLKLVMEQKSREVLWVFDPIGNAGKTFLSQYMNILYRYQLIDGSINTRDLTYLLKNKKIQGVIFDLARTSQNTFDYATIESLKNGFLCSGKYAGKEVRIPRCNVVIFGNFHPNLTALSADRWQVVELFKGVLADTSLDPVVAPNDVYPFNEPQQPPDLEDSCNNDNFNEIGMMNCQEMPSAEGIQNHTVEVTVHRSNNGELPTARGRGELDRSQNIQMSQQNEDRIVSIQLENGQSHSSSNISSDNNNNIDGHDSPGILISTNSQLRNEVSDSASSLCVSDEELIPSSQQPRDSPVSFLERREKSCAEESLELIPASLPQRNNLETQLHSTRGRKRKQKKQKKQCVNETYYNYLTNCSEVQTVLDISNSGSLQFIKKSKNSG